MTAARGRTLRPTPYFSAAGPEGVRRLGDRVIGLTGVLTQGFGAYRVHPTTATPVPRPATRARPHPPWWAARSRLPASTC